MPGERDRMLTPQTATIDATARVADLQQIAALTARMLAASANDEWDLVGDLESQRSSLLCAMPPSFGGTDTAAVRAILSDALASTHQIMARIRDLQAAEQEGLGEIRRGRQAALGYLENMAR